MAEDQSECDGPGDLGLEYAENVTGIDFLKAIRADKALKELPFLMVTSEADKGKIREAVKAGVDQYIVKPFNTSQLEEKIREIFPN